MKRGIWSTKSSMKMGMSVRGGYHVRLRYQEMFHVKDFTQLVEVNLREDLVLTATAEAVSLSVVICWWW